jgi:hypothetical protein
LRPPIPTRAADCNGVVAMREGFRLAPDCGMRPSHAAQSHSLVPWAVWFMAFGLIVGIAADRRVNAKLTSPVRAFAESVSGVLADLQAP